MKNITNEQAHKLLTACKEMFAEAYRNEYARVDNFGDELYSEFQLAWDAIHLIEPGWFKQKIENAKSEWIESKTHDDLRYFDSDNLSF